MSTHSSRRSFLKYAAAGVSTVATSRIAIAQATVEPPPRALQVENAVVEPVSVEVNARVIPHFEPRDRTRTRFGSLEYRSGLVLTSPYRGFGGLSGLRLDATGGRFLAVSDQGAGIEPEDRETVFERAKSKRGSTGLGLSIARALVEADGGRLVLADPATARFEIRMPSPSGRSSEAS